MKFLILHFIFGCRDASKEGDTGNISTDTAIDETEDTTFVVNQDEFACDPPLQSIQEEWSVPLGGAVRLQGTGGSGDYRWTVSEETPYGFIDAYTGLFTSTQTETNLVKITMTDTNCSDEVEIEISVTDRFVVSPGYAKVSAGITVVPQIFGGSGSVGCDFLINNSQASLSESCAYQAGPSLGKDVIAYKDLQTDEFQNITFDVEERVALDVWGKEIILPIGAEFQVSAIGGSGSFDVTTSDSSVAETLDGKIIANALGEAQIEVQDRYIPDFAESISVQVVSLQGYASEPWGSRTNYTLAKTYDIDGDGYEELLISNRSGGHGDEPYSGNILIFQGTPTGFELHATQEIGGFYTDEGFGYSFELADLNDDGVGDMVAAARTGGDGSIRIFYGDPATGLLQEMPTMVLHGYGFSLCDAGGDGIVDIVAGLSGLQGVVYRPVSGMFTPTSIELIDGRAFCSDFNADGIDDLMVSKRSYDAGYTYSYTWYLGVEGGAFIPTDIGFGFDHNRADGNVGGMGVRIRGVDINGDGSPSLGYVVDKEVLEMWGVADRLASEGYTLETDAILFYDGFETDPDASSRRERVDYDLIVLGDFDGAKQIDDQLLYYDETDGYHLIDGLYDLPLLADENQVVLKSDMNEIWTGLLGSERGILTVVPDVDGDALPDFATLYGNGRNVSMYGYETTSDVAYDFTYDSMASAGEAQGSGAAVVQFAGESEPTLIIGRPNHKSYEPLLVSTQWDGSSDWLPLSNDETINENLPGTSKEAGKNIIVEDINSDGYEDLMIYDQVADSYPVSCYANGYDGFYIFEGGAEGVSKTVQSSFQYYRYHTLDQVIIGDIDGNGVSEFLSLRPNYGDQLISNIDLDSTEANCGSTINEDTVGRRYATPMGDIDGDGCDEFAQLIHYASLDGSSNGSSAVVIYYGSGGDSCRTNPEYSIFSVRYGFQQSFLRLISAPNFDLDGDGHTDLVLSNTVQFTLSSKGSIALVPGDFMSALPTYEWDGVQLPSFSSMTIEEIQDDLLTYFKSPDADSQFGSQLKAVRSADGTQSWVAVGRPTSHHAGRESGSWELFGFENGAWKRTPDLIISGSGDDPDSGMGTVMTLSVIDGETWFAIGLPHSDYIGVDSGAAMGFKTTLVP
ncbi:MAG: hypothetical protein VX278_06765 [Myxococcota bacterium]|nr:hypothetical protein [Myxococcota bacterium]